MAQRGMAGDIDDGESLVNRRLYISIPEVIPVKIKGPYADRPECRKCEANIDGRCKTLFDTTWIIKTCPFVATKERLQRDRELLERRQNGREEDVRKDDYRL